MDRWHDEPRLDELLEDPILHILLDRDGVSADELYILIERTRQRLGLTATRPRRLARQFATSLM
jgi:hypothetical protein